MIRRSALFAVSVLVLLAGGFGSTSLAQSDDDRRIDRLEKQVRELRSIVFQGRDTGQPVEVKPAGPDPEVTALEQKLDAQADAVRQLTGQIEVLQHDLDAARQAAASAGEQNGQIGGQLKDLADRVTKLEQGGAAAQPRGPPPSAGAGGPPPGTLDAQAAAGGAPPPPPAPPTAASAYKRARTLLSSGEFAKAGDAFQAFIAQYGDSPEVPGAYYYLGQSDLQRQAYPDAVAAYANALKGWPKSAWAGDATVSLGRALAANNQAGQACAALAEFDRRYRTGAGAAVKAHAAEVKAQAHCGS